MSKEHRRRALLRAVTALAVGGALLTADPTSAGPTQESDPAVNENGSGGSARVDIEIDPLRADGSDIEQAFGDIRENVQSQRAALATAQQAVADAQLRLDAAQGVVAETQAQIDVLVGQSDDVVVRAFIAPPAQSLIDALSASTAVDATVKQTILDMQASSDADILAQLDEAQARLEDEQDIERAAAREADLAVSDAELALGDLQSAVSQQTAFTNEVEARLERDLGEIEALRDSDPELAEQLAARTSALAAQITEARRLAEEEDALQDAGVAPADPNAPTGPITISIEGGLAVVSCPAGLGSIQVAGVIARDLQGLLNLAADQGLGLCGDGWRDPAEQIALRRAHCGTSTYAIYQAPSSSCRPPTARPGTSKHERGLAIDFTCNGGGTVSWGDDCHDFLRAHAAEFGLYPLSGEPWHWSDDGN